MTSIKHKIKFRSVNEIDHIVKAKETFGHAVKLPDFGKFINGLPEVLGAKSLKNLILAMKTARKNNKPIILGMGAHSIKCGLTPWILALAREGFITAVAMNGACLIHDMELGLCGETSEDVNAHLDTGLFGSADEPGSILGKALHDEMGKTLDDEIGKTLQDQVNGKLKEEISTAPREEDYNINKRLGAIASRLLSSSDIFPMKGYSLIAGLSSLNIPITFHAALGTDTVHFHPAVDWGILGKALENDFNLFIEHVSHLDGGVYINLGSAVILPEVFLKALSIARNTGSKISDFTTANMDMIQHYRPRENVLKRPGGQAIALTGHHEIMIPLLTAALLANDSEDN